MSNVELMNTKVITGIKSEVKISNKQNIDVLVNNARILFSSGKVDLALRLVNQVLAIDSYNELALELTADIYIKKEKFELAEKCYYKMLKTESNAGIYLKLADLLYRQEKDEMALENYYKALEGITYETHLLFDIYKSIGNIFVKLGDLDSAYENYNKAYTINPNSDLLLVNYGTLEIQKNQFEKAKELFQRALSINTENEKAWLGLSLVHRQFGDIELSWSSLLRSLDVNFENDTAIQLLITWGVSDARKSELISVFEKRITTHTKDIKSYIKLASIYSGYRMYKFANTTLNDVLMISPENEEAVALLNKINLDRN